MSNSIMQSKKECFITGTTEEWRDILGTFGMYSVSNLGRVRMNGRNVRFTHARTGEEHFRYVEEKVLTPVDHGDGYLYVSLTVNGTRKNKYIHRLVAEAFLEQPTGCDVVDHKDFNKANNAADNLEWVTQKENVRRAMPKMCKPKKRCRQTNVGEKYIRERKGKFVLNIKGKSKTFATLEEAVAHREVML